VPTANGQEAQDPDEYWVFTQSLTPKVSGAGRSAASGGHRTGHEDAEGMASVGVRLTDQLGDTLSDYFLPCDR
jgi:hypothetical protein